MEKQLWNRAMCRTEEFGGALEEASIAADRQSKFGEGSSEERRAGERASASLKKPEWT